MARAIELDQEEEPEPTEAKEEQTKSPDSSYPQEQVPHTPDTTEEEPDDVRTAVTYLFTSTMKSFD